MGGLGDGPGGGAHDPVHPLYTSGRRTEPERQFRRDGPRHPHRGGGVGHDVLVTRVLRGCSAGAAGAAAALLLAGCPQAPPRDVTTRVDRDRATFLRADPALAHPVDPLHVEVGRVLDDTLGWDRTSVGGTVYRRKLSDPPPVPAPEEFQGRVATALGSLRDGGWLPVWSRCQVPAAREPGSRLGPESDWWVWEATGYKITDGVSYGFVLRAEYSRPGNGSVAVRLLAPNHRDPANLFPDAPAALPRGGSCIEHAGIAAATTADGVETRVSDRYSWPRSTRTRDPRER